MRQSVSLLIAFVIKTGAQGQARGPVLAGAPPSHPGRGYAVSATSTCLAPELATKIRRNRAATAGNTL